MESDPKRRKLDHPTLSRSADKGQGFGFRTSNIYKWFDYAWPNCVGWEWTASLQAIERDTVATSMNSPTVQVAQSSNTHFRIQQAKNYAVAQARQEGCMANFRIFDSPFGNFLVPVIPTRAELGG
ncbi:hypothetical protein TEA_005287 [Camellia sinensis var. sinensis]|uniref:Uncharacterized protein n=1 Tax=Camellia sinensis var. sinensis TaxID=542762 RepID=A0A4S4DUK5_CAMSN|nr:hypothetical protein TEA_005287 [Camellia sinensis var. sinensis]